MTDQNREQYRRAMIAMIDQAFTDEELEGLLYKGQWILERSATDKGTAAVAIVAECDRIISNREQFLHRYPTCMDADRNECTRAINIAKDVRARWQRQLDRLAARMVAP